MDCPSCGKSNREGARFCRYCAAVFTLRCAVCDAELVPDSIFCDSCASPVASAPTPAAAARKVVTVLFADLCGSTALEERMDAESVRSILDRFYAAMRAEVERHGGRVVKFTGDGLMAAFGVPEVHEDDAVRAVDAALAMRTELEALASDLGLELGLKSGINTGEVVVSGTDDDVVGDAVNVASRLEGAASAGEVLVGEDTWRLTRATTRYEAIEPLVLKGKSEPVPAYRLLSVDERTADSAAAPFVGRESELGTLLAAFQDTVDANAARLVTIIGSPGLGKTRLARELMSELGGQARMRETRCDPAGAQTFAPIADLLRAAANISETDTEDEVIAKLTARLPEDEPDRDRIAMRAAPILGVGLAGTTEETFWAVRRLIEAAASTQPVVLVLDDLHWAEPLLLDLVEHLAEWITDAPVLIVGTARPELRDMRPSLAEGGRAASVIALEGLDRSATARLALNLLGTDELPAELLDKIPASTEGNPLFVRELVRMLVDDGVLMRTQDGWSVTVDVDAIQVPPTIQSLLSARIDRLRNDERTVVELASVVGKEFYRGALHDLAPSGVRDVVDGCLESLRRKELVEPVGTYWIDEPVYRFHHVLIRDAVYRRLLKESRAELHERVAGWLEEKTADVLGEHDELVGYHLEQAHEHKRQLGRSDDALGRRAADLLGVAAKRALDRDDLPVAATLSGRALERLPAEDDATRSELLLIRCEALLSMRDVPAGTAAVAELERLATTPRLRAWTTCFSGHLAIATSPEAHEDTAAKAAAAAAELAALGDQAGAAKAYTVHAGALSTLGRFAESEAVLDAALSAARAANDRRRITATLGRAPEVALWGPSPVSRAGGRCLDIVRLLRITTGSPAVEATSLRCQAVLEAFRGRVDAARRMLRSARRTLIDLGLQREVLETDQSAGLVEIVAGDPAQAVPHLRAAFDGARTFGLDVHAAQSAALLARAYLMLEDVAEAEASVAASEELGGKDRKAGIDAGSVKAELLARRGAFDEARAVARTAVALADATDALFDQGNAYRSLARVLRAAGDAAGAKGAEDRAFALFERKGATALIDSATEPVSPPALMTVPDAGSGLRWNRCAMQVQEFTDRLNAGDVAGAAAMNSDQVVLDDRRSGLRWTLTGAEHAENIRRSAQGEFRIELRLHAVRGERLALTSSLWLYTRRSYEVEFVFVTELGDDGRVSAVVQFDPSDLDAAFAELDERYVAGEGAACAAPFKRVNDLMEGLNDRNWLAAHDVFLPDATVHDRTPASRGEMSVDRFIESFKELVELTAELRVRVVAVHAVCEDAIVAEAHNRGVSVDGVEVDLAYQTLVVHRDGHIARLELFPAERLDLALQRFDELTASPSREPVGLENRCTRVNAAYNDAFNRRDFGRVFSILSKRSGLEDRRKGMRSRVKGRDDVVANLRTVADLGPIAVNGEVIANRGESLALVLDRWASTDPAYSFTAELLSVVQVDADGRFEWAVTFDPEDLDAALKELDERYVAHEGSADPELVRLLGEFGRAYTARDLDRLRALFTDDFVVVDHRPASSGTLDREGLLDWLSAAYELTEDAVAHAVAVHAITPGRMLVRFQVRGTTNEGALYETAIHFIIERRGNQIARAEQFAFDQLDIAVRRFEELGAERGSELDNRSMAALRYVVEYVGRGDWEALAELYTDESVIEDRRRGLRTVVRGRDAIVELSKHSHEAFAIRQYTCIAIRGERLSLTRGTWRASGGEEAFDAEVLRLGEIDDDGHVVYTVIFDPEDLDAAFTELDERYASAEFSLARTFRLGSRLTHAINTADWDAVRAQLADELVIVDHRPASLGELRDPQAFVDSVRTLAELTSAYRMQVVDYLRVGPSSGLVEMRNVGTSQEGGTFESTSYVVSRNAMDKVVHLEIYPPEQLAAAIARFDELEGASAPSRRLENRCTRTVTALFDAFERKDLEVFLSHHADTFTHEDRRTGMRNVIRGHDELTANVQAAWDIGGGRTVIETIAIRGERLALNLKSYQYSGTDRVSDFVSPQLIVDEIDDDGRAMLVTVFDPEQLDDAFAELDRRYAAGEGAIASELVEFGSRFCRAVNAADWDAARALVSDDLIGIDHRPASLGELRDPDAWIASVRTLSELAASYRMQIAAYVRLDQRGCVADMRNVVMSREGGTFETASYVVIRVTNAQLGYVEVYPPGKRDAAIAKFDELSSRDAPRPSLENAATRNAIAGGDAMGRGDWEAFRTLYAPDVVSDDRRRGVGSRGVGVDAFITNFKTVHELGFRTGEQRVVATRGERLALVMGTMTDPVGNVLDGIVLFETDDEGRSKHIIYFDADDLDSAFRELGRRYADGEGQPFAEILRLHADQSRAYALRDWGAYRRSLDDGFVLVDHSPAGAGTLNADEFIGYVQAFVELAPDIELRAIEIVAIAPDRMLLRQWMHGASAEGAEIERRFLGLNHYRAGRTVRLEQFREEQIDLARQRFDELLAPNANDATRALDRFSEAFTRRDWDTIIDLVHDDHVRDDRRAGLSGVAGKGAVIDGWKANAELGYERFTLDHLATRGDRLCLVRGLGTGSHGFETEAVVVQETDGAGRVIRSVYFDADELDAAFDELDERFLATEGVPESLRWQLESGFAYNARDWDRYRAMMADDFVFVDHRAVSAGTLLGADDAVTHRKTLTELVPDCRLAVTGAIRCEPRVCLVTLWIYGTDEHGGPVEYEHHVIQVVEDGLSTRSEVFTIADLDNALARFDELVAERTRPRLAIENDATRAMERFCEAFARRDWDVLAGVLHDDATRDDRRRGLGGIAGKHLQIEAWKTNADLGFDRVIFNHLATRGERLSLSHGLGTGSHGFDFEVLAINETDGTGRIVRSVVFDPDEFDAAFDELDERYLASGHATETERLGLMAVRAINAGDWATYRTYLSEDYVTVSYHPAGAGKLEGVDANIESIRAIRELIPDRQVRPRRTIRDEAGVLLVSMWVHGTNETGGEVEFEHLFLARFEHGRLTRVEFFPLERLDDALARFDELARDS